MCAQAITPYPTSAASWPMPSNARLNGPANTAQVRDGWSGSTT